MNIPHAYFVFMVIAAALISWGISTLIEQDQADEATLVEGGAEYFSNGYQKIEMDQAGKPKSDLIADNMVHYNKDGSTNLANPLMTLYNKNPKPWVIQSEKGVLSGNGEDLLLTGHVSIKRAAAPGLKPLSVKTSNLAVKLPTNYAETADWAEITSLRNKTEGVGMKVTFVEPVHLQLLANVKGHYELQ